MPTKGRRDYDVVIIRVRASSTVARAAHMLAAAMANGAFDAGVNALGDVWIWSSGSWECCDRAGAAWK